MKLMTVWFRIGIHIMFFCYCFQTIEIQEKVRISTDLFHSGMQMLKTNIKKPCHMTELIDFGETLFLA